MRSADEIESIFEIARSQGSSKIEIDGVTYYLSKVSEPKAEPQDLDAQVKAIFSSEEYTDEEILFYHSPYFDEIQLRKKEQAEKLNGKA